MHVHRATDDDLIEQAFQGTTMSDCQRLPVGKLAKKCNICLLRVFFHSHSSSLRLEIDDFIYSILF